MFFVLDPKDSGLDFRNLLKHKYADYYLYRVQSVHCMKRQRFEITIVRCTTFAIASDANMKTADSKNMTKIRTVTLNAQRR